MLPNFVLVTLSYVTMPGIIFSAQIISINLVILVTSVEILSVSPLFLDPNLSLSFARISLGF